MTRRKNTPAVEAAPAPTQNDPFEYIRLGLLEVAPLCDSCGNFQRGVMVAPLAKQIGVPPVTLSDYLRDGREVGRVTLTRFINFLNARKGVETAEQAEAIAEVEALA
jgi:hypothetical protein